MLYMCLQDKLTEGVKPDVAAAIEAALKNKDDHVTAAKTLGLPCCKCCVSHTLTLYLLSIPSQPTLLPSPLVFTG